jgi:hypothetical protein
MQRSLLSVVRAAGVPSRAILPAGGEQGLGLPAVNKDWVDGSCGSPRSVHAFPCGSTEILRSPALTQGRHVEPTTRSPAEPVSITARRNIVLGANFPPAAARISSVVSLRSTRPSVAQHLPILITAPSGPSAAGGRSPLAANCVIAAAVAAGRSIGAVRVVLRQAGISAARREAAREPRTHPI